MSSSNDDDNNNNDNNDNYWSVFCLCGEAECQFFVSMSFISN